LAVKAIIQDALPLNDLNMVPWLCHALMSRPGQSLLQGFWGYAKWLDEVDGERTGNSSN
jgi:hypothetical protein